MSILFGLNDHRSPATSKSMFPGMKATRPFVSGVRTVATTDLVAKINAAASSSLSAGLQPWVSFKLDTTEVANGAWDAQLARVGREIDPNIILIPWHEPENDMSASTFVQMFDRVATRIKAIGRGHTLVYSAMAYQFRSGSTTTTNPLAWFPASADLYAADVYSGQSFPLNTILPENKGFMRWNEFRPKGVPWGITERGFITGTEHQLRADTIAREAEWLKTSGMDVYLYWNTSGAENNPDIVLDAQYGEPALKKLLSTVVTTPEPDPTYDEGYAAGYAAGKIDGHESGLSEGYAKAKQDAVAAVQQIGL